VEDIEAGTRIVARFRMGDWKPEQTLNVDGATVYYWTIARSREEGGRRDEVARPEWE
jgi:hypothetical protein